MGYWGVERVLRALSIRTFILTALLLGSGLFGQAKATVSDPNVDSLADWNALTEVRDQILLNRAKLRDAQAAYAEAEDKYQRALTPYFKQAVSEEEMKTLEVRRTITRIETNVIDLQISEQGIDEAILSLRHTASVGGKLDLVELVKRYADRWKFRLDRIKLSQESSQAQLAFDTFRADTGTRLHKTHAVSSDRLVELTTKRADSEHAVQMWETRISFAERAYQEALDLVKKVQIPASKEISPKQ